jgi:hypothetical protein
MATRLEKLQATINKIDEELAALAKFRQTPQNKRFIRQLHGERSYIKGQITKVTMTEEQRRRQQEEGRISANRNRTEKMKRAWRFFEAMEKNYDIRDAEGRKLGKKKIRSLYELRKQGLQTAIDDIIWRNPSP